MSRPVDVNNTTYKTIGFVFIVNLLALFIMFFLNFLIAGFYKAPIFWFNMVIIHLRLLCISMAITLLLSSNAQQNYAINYGKKQLIIISLVSFISVFLSFKGWGYVVLLSNEVPNPIKGLNLWYILVKGQSVIILMGGLLFSYLISYYVSKLLLPPTKNNSTNNVLSLKILPVSFSLLMIALCLGLNLGSLDILRILLLAVISHDQYSIVLLVLSLCLEVIPVLIAIWVFQYYKEALVRLKNPLYLIGIAAVIMVGLYILDVLLISLIFSQLNALSLLSIYTIAFAPLILLVSEVILCIIAFKFTLSKLCEQLPQED